MSTDTEKVARIAANKRRYDELKAAGDHAPAALPAPTPRGLPLPPGPLVREDIPAGWYHTLRLKAGEGLRLALMDAPAAVSLICWNAHDTSERLNYADTVKIQWTAKLQKGRVIFSDMGRVMLSLIEDTSAAHDALMGGSTAASNRARYGAKADTERLRNTRDNFILAAGKLGLDRRDIPPALTFFAPVRTDDAGKLAWGPDTRQAGDFVDLRAEMDLIVALSNCPHPLDPRPDYAAGIVEAIRFQAPPIAFDDLCRTATPEAARGFENLAR
ncbi:urea carboxylase [Azorhizobium oxalatiphilum]|uniref:Urea carboxylase n=1 Tax=Azorhizobium oxalatiphilum TaxID=980631 RepID=A0A917CAD1_9HYPH|nr:urea amidolyase associated protein UAAP1 [Azorhizobium oxalatiphilum]GGF77705.1 urea carboxylase [Azorhizobium oxalatiphilum]